MARAPKASFDLAADRHPLQDEHDAEVARLADLKTNPANSWLIDMSEARVAALLDAIQE